MNNHLNNINMKILNLSFNQSEKYMYDRWADDASMHASYYQLCFMKCQNENVTDLVFQHQPPVFVTVKFVTVKVCEAFAMGGGRGS